MVFAIEESHACQVSLTTVAIVALVTPNRGISRESIFQGFAFSHLPAHSESTVGIVPYRMYRLSRLAIEDREQFWSCLDSSCLVALIRLVVYRQDISIGGSLAHKLTLAIHATRRCLADHLSLAIAIEVIDEELGIVGTGTDVLPQVDAP